jgi:hypothetical protein
MYFKIQSSTEILGHTFSPPSQSGGTFLSSTLVWDDYLAEISTFKKAKTTTHWRRYAAIGKVRWGICATKALQKTHWRRYAAIGKVRWGICATKALQKIMYPPFVYL